MINNKDTCNNAKDSELTMLQKQKTELQQAILKNEQELQQLEKLKKELENNNASNCLTKIKRMLFNSSTDKTKQEINNLFVDEFNLPSKKK